MKTGRILFFGRTSDPLRDELVGFLKANFGAVDTVLGGMPGEAIPEAISRWEGDYIVSFRSLCVLPETLLARARKLALNFHPGPPEYPGIGCVNFALYDGVDRFGVTCHHMLAAPDSGPIVAVRRFALLASDNVESLLLRTHAYLKELFVEILGQITSGRTLELSGEVWRGKPTRRKDMEALYRIPINADEREMARRIRATAYRQHQPWIELHGRRFCLQDAASESCHPESRAYPAEPRRGHSP